MKSPKRRLHCRKISTGENSNDTNIPIDLVVEIFKKLPGKSLMRFRCLSKQLSSIISYNRYFIDSIVTRPSRHTDLFVHYNVDKTGKARYSFLSSTYNTDKELVPIPGISHQYVRGLIFCYAKSPCASAIYNPTTR
ncbi:putative F-box protein [Cardamine amara subsp. amara]|uniref:F-box protein n=1 Tax=Cardamine amara subsp. amara TaxID=228776 RepID=A0ABD1AIG9_CARAN